MWDDVVCGMLCVGMMLCVGCCCVWMLVCVDVVVWGMLLCVGCCCVGDVVVCGMLLCVWDVVVCVGCCCVWDVVVVFVSVVFQACDAAVLYVCVFPPVKCLECLKTSDTFDPLLDVSLDIKNCNSLTRALQKSTQVDTLENDNSYACPRSVFLVNTVCILLTCGCLQSYSQNRSKTFSFSIPISSFPLDSLFLPPSPQSPPFSLSTLQSELSVVLTQKI